MNTLLDSDCETDEVYQEPSLQELAIEFNLEAFIGDEALIQQVLLLGNLQN